MKSENNPMHLPMHDAPRCSAKSKRSGFLCKAPAVRGRKTCRMHGGTSTGAPIGEGNGNYRHGGCTNEWLKVRRAVSELSRSARIVSSSARNVA